MRKKQRVVVTGMAVCSPLGTDVETFKTNSLNGRPCIGPITNFDVVEHGFTRVAGIVHDFEPSTLFTATGRPPVADRTFLMAKHCIENALTSAGLQGSELRSTCSLYMSSAISQMGSMESLFVTDDAAQSGSVLPTFSFGALTGTLATSFGLYGGHVLLPTGCVGGCDAVSYGADMIRHGLCDRAIVGAAEAPITPLVVAAFGRIGANSTRECDPREASCPFDTRRDGFVLSEGAAMLVLESEEAARQRGAKILAEVTGYGSVNNCYHMTDIPPEGDAIAEACRRALKTAAIEPGDIDFINSHGSSTPQNDVAESAGFRKVFGRTLDRIPVTSLKSQCGHALSAANAIEMVSTVCSIREAVIPPTINLQNQDPACTVTVVAGRSATHTVKHALKISSGFSGIHTAVVMSAYQA